MGDAALLIIDDVEAALRRLSPLGRELVEEPAIRIREVVYEYATRRKWSVLRHGTFAKWAIDLVRREPRHWIVLDPLLQLEEAGGRAHPLRITRVYDSQGQRPFAGTLRLAPEQGMAEVGLLDDAAGSGRTLRRVISVIHEAGGDVSHTAVAAASEQARRSIPRAGGIPRWLAYLPGDWRTIHLRDGCPFVPLAGRPIGKEPLYGQSGRAIEQRVLASDVIGHPWQVLEMDRAVSHAISAARTLVAQRLTEVLGRPATVGDIELLGDEVHLPVASAESVDALSDDLIPRSM